MKALLLAMALAFAAAAQNPQVETGSVEGTLRRAGTGDPVAGGGVSLGEFIGDNPRATTDQDGHFQILGVPPGSYRIHTSSIGEVRPEQGGGPRTVKVGVAEHVKGVDLVVVPMAVISGRVLGADGTPLTGASVTPLRVRYISGRQVFSPSFLGLPPSDNRGEYRLQVPPGEYYIQVKSTDPRYGATYFPGFLEFAKAQIISVGPGEEASRVDFSIQPAALRRISGRVPCDFLPALVQLFPPSEPTNGLLPSETAYPPRAPSPCGESNGKFEVKGLVPGAYDLYVRELKGQRLSHIRVDVSTADVENLTLGLHPPVEVSGRIAVAEGSASVPFSSMNITLMMTGGAPLSLPTTSGKLNQDGSFVVPNVREARYSIYHGGLPEDTYVADVLQGTSSILESGLIVGKTSPEPIRVILKAPGGIVEGVVLDANQKGVAFTSVLLVPRSELRQNFSLQKAATTDGGGRFSIRGIAPGDYKIFAWERPSYYDDRPTLPDEFISKYEESGTPIKVDPASRVENVGVRFITQKR